ncbi:hypothetical protein Bca101_019001 [Brassica carinata]
MHIVIAADEIAELWREYEANANQKRKLLQFDKLELILQALEYEQEQGKDLEEFFQSTAGKFHTDIGKAWALEICFKKKKAKVVVVSSQRQRPESATSDCDLMSLYVVRLQVVRLIAAFVAELFVCKSCD